MRRTRPARTGSGRALAAVLGLALLVLLKATAALALPIAASVLVVLLLSGPVERLQTRGLPGALAAALMVFVPAGALVALGVGVAPAAAGWLGDIRAACARLAEAVPASTGGLGAALRKLASGDGLDGAAATLPAEAGETAFALASVLMLSFFVLWGQRALLAALLRAAPDRRARIRLLGALRDARRGAGRYLATMGWINLGLAALTGLGLVALGIPHVPAWIAVIFGLLFVPYLGPAAIALLLATARPGASVAAIAVPPLLFLALHAVEAQFVSPWLMGRRLRVGRPALLLSVMAGAWAWGVAGGVLAVPLLIAGQALVARRRGAAFWKALLAQEPADAASLADSAAHIMENRPGGSVPAIRELGVHRTPRPTDPIPACASPTSLKPTSPKSTALP